MFIPLTTHREQRGSTNMDGMNNVLALQSLSPDNEEANTGGLAGDNMISHASALLCDGYSHLSVLACN